MLDNKIVLIVLSQAKSYIKLIKTDHWSKIIKVKKCNETPVEMKTGFQKQS